VDERDDWLYRPGIMGQPMRRNLLRGGHKLVVYNRTVSKARPWPNWGLR